VTLLLSVLVALAGAAGACALRRVPALAMGVGLTGGAIAVAFVLATPVGTILLTPDPGGGAIPILEMTGYGRLLIALLGVGGLALSVGAAAGGLVRRPPEVDAVPTVAAVDLGLAGIAVAVVAFDPMVAAWAILAGGAGVVLVGLAGTGGDRPAGQRDRMMTSLAALRIAVATAAIAVIGIAWAARILSADEPDMGIAAIAYLGFVGAVAVRSGAVPLHGWAARFADLAALGVVAVAIVWLPAAWTVTALTWTDASMAAIATDLGVARGLVLAVALATMALAALAAWIQDDLRHLSVYLVIAGAGVALLGLSAMDPAAWAPSRIWLPVGALAGSAGLAVALALDDRYGTRRLPELGGWGRRSPGLAVAVVCIAIALVGVPGTAGWTAREDLVTAAIDGPLAWIARLLLLAPLAILGRVLVVGLTAESPTVRLVEGWRPPSMVALQRRPVPSEGGEGEADTRGHSTEERDPEPVVPDGSSAPRRRPSARLLSAAAGERGDRMAAAARTFGSGVRTPSWRPRGSTIATAAALVIALLGLAVSLGAFDVTGAAAGGPPGGEVPGASAEPTSSPSPEPSSSPPSGSLAPGSQAPESPSPGGSALESASP
jgi:NADH-quinone oxidoreductase subunit N